MILAVDGGNSKTDLALVDSDGRLLAALRGPTTSHQQIGFEPGIERMAELVADLRNAAGVTSDAPAQVGVYGLAGADTPADTRRLAAALGRRGLAADVVVVNDAFTPIRAGAEHGWGVALICGQGVNAAGIAPDGHRRTHARQRAQMPGKPKSRGASSTSGAVVVTSASRHREPA